MIVNAGILNVTGYAGYLLGLEQVGYPDFLTSSADALIDSQYADRQQLIHELILRLKARYDEEGIEIPFPQRVVHMPGAAGTPAG